MEEENTFSRVRKLFLQFNLFNTNSRDERNLRIERWSTRLYIPILLSSLSILLVYTILEVHSKQIQISNPSLSTYLQLHEKYENIKCLCTDIAISHDKFLQISASFHQVCSSDLIDNEWIEFLYEKDKTTSRYGADFRATAFNQFQILQSLCQLSSSAINDGIETLYHSELISRKLLDENLFLAQVQANILSFQTITISDFGRSLSFMRQFMADNMLLTGVQTSHSLTLKFNDGNITGYTSYYIFFVREDETACSCRADPSCYLPAGFYDVDEYYIEGRLDMTLLIPYQFVDGWKISCWPVESLLLSTLQSFYNQTTLNQILTNINSSVLPDRFIALNSSNSSTFNPNATLDILVQNLFIEKWSQTLNYSSYYTSCQPQSCQYNIDQHSEPIYIITSLLGLYGGLSVILHFIIPIIVKFILERFERRSTTTVDHVHNNNVRWSLRKWIENTCKRILHLNLYRNPLRLEAPDVKHQIWSTRLYIGLLSLSLFILILYSSISIERRIIQIDHPSFDLVQQLEKNQFPLTCPCEIWSINYEDLFKLSVIYHQICSSKFIRSEWFEYFNAIHDYLDIQYWKVDFRQSVTLSFLTLNAMCDLSNRTVSNALFQFGKNQFITSELIRSDLFPIQTTSIIDQFQQTLPKNFIPLLQLMSNITYLNQFLSGDALNFDIQLHFDEQSSTEKADFIPDGFLPLGANDTSKDICLCANNITCGINSAIYTDHPDLHIKTVDFIISNFYVRCYSLESLLPSTMQCFYDDSPCLGMINDIISEYFPINFTQLNSSQPSHFPIDTTVDNLLGNLFVDFWSKQLLYQSYFEKCQPIYCSYTINQRKSPIEIVTTIAGLIGGLATIFKYASPYLLSALFYLINRFQHRNQTIDPNRTITVRKRLADALKNMRVLLLNLNIFANSDNPSLDENDIRIEKQSTRLYIVLLFLTIVILIFYTSLTYRSNEVIVPISSLESLIKFQNFHRSILVNCSCTKLSTIRSTFYKIKPKFHQICSSDFVSDQWLNKLFESYQNVSSLPTSIFTFNRTAFAHFQSMSIMCNLAKQAVIDARELFLQTSVVSSQMPPMDLFYFNTNLTLNNFQSSLSSTFNHRLQMFRGLSQGNGLASVYSTNWNLFLLSDFRTNPTIYMKSQSYGECDCAISSSCIQDSIPFVRGYVVGCLPIESYLLSTFECLYSELCVNQISSYVQSSFIPKSLNETELRFAMNTSINDLVKEMFIESWSNNVSYARFFEECQPRSCSYVLTERYNVLYVITTLLGLYGGITILFKLITPFTIRQIHKGINRFRQRNQRIMPLN